MALAPASAARAPVVVPGARLVSGCSASVPPAAGGLVSGCSASVPPAAGGLVSGCSTSVPPAAGAAPLAAPVVASTATGYGGSAVAQPAVRTSYGAPPGARVTTTVSTSYGAAPGASSSTTPASMSIRVNGTSYGPASTYGQAGGPVAGMLTFKAGDKVTIGSTMAQHAGKVAYVEGADGDNVKVRLEAVLNEFGDKGPGQQVISMNPMHLQFGSGASPQPAVQASAVNLGALQLPSNAPAGGFLVGTKVRLGGPACPAQYCGKCGYVAKSDCGDGTGRVKIRLEATYSVHDGFISTGGTFLKEIMTVEEAKVKCAMMGGKGFTHSGGETVGPVHIFMKNKWDIQGTGWTSYKIEPDPDGLPSWTLMNPIHLTPC